MKRRILYVTGTRADFGLLRSTLKRMQTHPGLDVSLCVTGQHLSRVFGYTAREVEASGLPILGRVKVDLAAGDGAMMARAVGRMAVGITDLLVRHPQDAILVLGDRGEMLAGAIAAIHLNTTIFHIHGGERTGTVDEPVRHAISKLSHYHFATTQDARRRLIRMGENAKRVFVTGAPGLDGIRSFRRRSREELAATQRFDPSKRIALLLFHPVLQEADEAGRQMRTVLRSLLSARYQIICLKPNSDAGNSGIVSAMREFEGNPLLRNVTHLTRDDYLSWLAAVDVLVGNSSSGIIEAASFHLPVVNIGSRQEGRERSGNVVDCAPTAAEVAQALKVAAALKGRSFKNVYGEGRAGVRISRRIASLPLGGALLKKQNSY